MCGLLFHIFCCFFFFFKQKTAYEMRISDWSSDVCSSDLPSARGRILSFISNESVTIMADETGIDINPAPQANGEDTAPAIGLISQYEIGRASCRERVCQYV